MPCLFIEQEGPSGIVIDDLDFIHVVGSMTQSAKTSSSDSWISWLGSMRVMSNEIRRAKVEALMSHSIVHARRFSILRGCGWGYRF